MISRWRESSGTSFGSQGRPPARVELVDGLGEPAEVVEVAEGRIAADRAAPDERRPLHRHEDHVASADHDVVHGIARVEREARRRLGDLLVDERGIQPDDVAFDVLPGRREQAERLRVVELDPDLGDEPVPAGVQDLERLGREDLEPRLLVEEHGSRP